MCDINNEKVIDQLDPTFLFIWKGTRVSDEENYHSHDYIEMAYVLSGEGRYRIDDAFYEIGGSFQIRQIRPPRFSSAFVISSFRGFLPTIFRSRMMVSFYIPPGNSISEPDINQMSYGRLARFALENP